jgi:hypothetical protein
MFGFTTLFSVLFVRLTPLIAWAITTAKSMESIITWFIIRKKGQIQKQNYMRAHIHAYNMLTFAHICGRIHPLEVILYGKIRNQP